MWLSLKNSSRSSSQFFLTGFPVKILNRLTFSSYVTCKPLVEQLIEVSDRPKYKQINLCLLALRTCLLQQTSTIDSRAVTFSWSTRCNLSACDPNSASKNLSSWQMKREPAQPVQAGQTRSRAKLLRRHRPTAKTISSRLPLFFWSGYVLIIILSLFWLTVFLSHTLVL